MNIHLECTGFPPTLIRVTDGVQEVVWFANWREMPETEQDNDRAIDLILLPGECLWAQSEDEALLAIENTDSDGEVDIHFYGVVSLLQRSILAPGCGASVALEPGQKVSFVQRPLTP